MLSESWCEARTNLRCLHRLNPGRFRKAIERLFENGLMARRLLTLASDGGPIPNTGYFSDFKVCFAAFQ